MRALPARYDTRKKNCDATTHNLELTKRACRRSTRSTATTSSTSNPVTGKPPPCKTKPLRIIHKTSIKKKNKNPSARFDWRHRRKGSKGDRHHKPLFLHDENGEPVWITSATLSDIRDRQQKQKKAPRRQRKLQSSPVQQPPQRQRLELVTVPSCSVRTGVYQKAARALERLETRLLPTYGGRTWKVVVTVEDPTTGTTTSKSTMSTTTPYFVWKESLCSSSNGRCTEELQMAVWPHLLEKIPLPPRFPGYTTKKSSSKSAAATAATSSSLSSSPKSSVDVVSSAAPSKTPESDSSSIDKQESATQLIREEAEEVDDVDEAVEMAEEDEELSVSESEERVFDEIDHLLGEESTPLSRLAYAERGRVPMPDVHIKWISPLLKTFTSRKSAVDHAMQLCRQEIFLDKHLRGRNAHGALLTDDGSSSTRRPSKRVALKAGRLRFERDGLWVVGQEESWQSERADIVPIRKRNLSPLLFYIQSLRKEHQNNRSMELHQLQQQQQQQQMVSLIEEPVVTESSNGKEKMTRFTLRDSERELRAMWRQLSDDERVHWTRKCKVHCENALQTDSMTPCSTPVPAGTMEVASCDAKTPSRSEIFKETYLEGSKEGSVLLPLMPTFDNPNQQARLVSPSPPTVLTPSSSSTFSNSGSAPIHSIDIPTTFTTLSLSPIPIANVREATAPETVFSASTHWRLNATQCKLCYDAGMQHLHQILRTVQRRDLFREMQDGFDLLRERGRGRYDMELPVFDTDAFSFLTDLKKAPWMPVVREILGKEVVLIHKGMFLALPEADKQVYHQDGVHLTTKYQRDAHAINVFIPVVDMTSEMGPTEFCVGSHLLGNEDLNEKFVDVPLVTAGTPIIFDYRLGHRGLANASQSNRPVVYCTYARSADGKEFRDKVNFSRKRYHAIGELVCETATREERFRKRSRMSML